MTQPQELRRRLTIFNRQDVGEVEIDSSVYPPIGDEAMEVYADLMSAIFSEACARLNPDKQELKLGDGELQLNQYPVEGFTEYIKLFVTRWSEEKGGKILFGYNPKRNKLNVEFNTLKDGPANFDVGLAQAILGLLA